MNNANESEPVISKSGAKDGTRVATNTASTASTNASKGRDTGARGRAFLYILSNTCPFNHTIASMFRIASSDSDSRSDGVSKYAPLAK